MRYLKSIQNKPETAPSGFYQGIVAAWNSKAPYPEVVLLLDILKAKSIDSPEVYQSLLALLEDDLMVSRAVYWFLVDKPLTPEQQLKLKMFEQNHAEALN
ncbi:hypothetical protein CLV98_105142 [Dyadobacter jejuensis]|uniref:Uncharacterized protein n=1 Tax=Dyadobacter jejuensis TaxID=1082580 RepID=A0A316AKD1_9BACT|nr:hypothetical protein [Dyadobacter jejuensis]PWJ57962.1 hypothetical protein CLV98_105142 [Dyadobacter jejuensis]